MRSLLNAELKVLRKRKATWVVLGVLLIFLALGYYMIYFFSDIQFPKEFLLPAKAMQYTILQLGDNGVYLAAIFGGLFFGSPFSWRTYETRLVQAQSRDWIFGSKLVANLLTLATWLAVGLAFGHAISFSLGFLEGNIAYSTPGIWLVLRATLLVLVVWFTWFMLAGVITVWSKSTAMGIGLSLAYYFLESIIFNIPGFRSIIEGYSHFFLYQASSGMIRQLFPGGSPYSNAPLQNLSASIQGLIPVIFGYLIGFIVLGWWRFRTMEIAEH